MSLQAEAYLEIDGGGKRTAQFQFKIGLQQTTEIEKSYIMARRGQYIREIFDNLANATDLSNTASTEQRRAGYWIDGGAGSVSHTLAFITGTEEDNLTWGDGSGGTGPDNVTKFDASGAGVHPLTRKQVLEYWITRSRTDSFGQARLHRGEWTDGTVGGVSAGVYEQPIMIAITNSNIEEPDPDRDINSIEGTITYERVQWLDPDNIPDWVSNKASKALEKTNGIEDN